MLIRGTGTTTSRQGETAQRAGTKGVRTCCIWLDGELKVMKPARKEVEFGVFASWEEVDAGLMIPGHAYGGVLAVRIRIKYLFLSNCLKITSY